MLCTIASCVSCRTSDDAGTTAKRRGRFGHLHAVDRGRYDVISDVTRAVGRRAERRLDR